MAEWFLGSIIVDLQGLRQRNESGGASATHSRSIPPLHCAVDSFWSQAKRQNNGILDIYFATVYCRAAYVRLVQSGIKEGKRRAFGSLLPGSASASRLRDR